MALNAIHFGGSIPEAHKAQTVLSWWKRNLDTAMIAIATGMPESECANILARHLDHSRNTVRVPHRLSEDQRHIRNRQIVRLYQDGATLKDIGIRMGISGPRVHQIIAKSGAVDRGPRGAGGIYTDDARVGSLADLYQSGLSIKEISQYEEISVVTVGYALGTSPDYHARKRVSWSTSTAVNVPHWVPATYHGRFIHLSRMFGEDVAASCARFAKKSNLVDVLPAVS